MTAYVTRRIVISVPVLLGVTLITFLLLHAAAGNFVPGLEQNPTLSPADVARVRASLGLDAPLYLQYLGWLGGVLHGDLGRSLLDGTPVTGHILERLPNTLELTAAAMLIALVVAIPLGLTGALRRGSALDHAVTLLSVIGVSVPAFWLGLVLVLVFSVQLHSWGLPFLPASGAYSTIGGGDPLDRLAHLVLPAFVLSLGYIAIWSRYVRSSMLEVLSQDYVRTARAKGMSERRVLYVHALRNALVPMVTLLGFELPGLLSGAAVIEIVFGWPGIGRLALERALSYDYTVVLGLATFSGVLVIAGNLLADVLYAVLDPRIRHS
jgi:peptide/nickel transport system permease protein